MAKSKLSALKLFATAAKATRFKSAVPAGEANGSVQMSVPEPENQMSVQQNDDLQSTEHKVDLATKIQGQMQKPAANCGCSSNRKVRPKQPSSNQLYFAGSSQSLC